MPDPWRQGLSWSSSTLWSEGGREDCAEKRTCCTQQQTTGGPFQRKDSETTESWLITETCNETLDTVTRHILVLLILVQAWVDETILLEKFTRDS